MKMKFPLVALMLFFQLQIFSQVAVPVGSGSYASYPPDAVLDKDGFYARPYREVRDDWPYYIHPDRQSDPIPTNEWWSNALFSQYTGDLWSYPCKVTGTSGGVTIAAVTRFNAIDARAVQAETDSYLWISGEVDVVSDPNTVILAEFEGDAYPSGWTATGDMIGKTPITTAENVHSFTPTGFVGASYIDTYYTGNQDVGTLTSPTFTVDKNYMHLQVAGGAATDAEVRIEIGGVEVYSQSGNNNGTFEWYTWDLSAYQGQTAQVVIADETTAGWGFIMCDNIVLSDDATVSNSFSSSFWPANALAYQWSDLSFTFRLEDSNNNLMDVTSVHGVPFTYVDMNGISPFVSFSATPSSYYDGAGNTVSSFPANVNTLVCNVDGILFGIHAPEGSTFDWVGSSIAITNSSGRPAYAVVSQIPETSLIATYDAVSRNKIVNTTFSWATDPGEIATSFSFETENYETKASGGNTIFSMLPHQWRDSELSTSLLSGAEYSSLRGQMKSTEESEITITYPFSGMAPYMPAPLNLTTEQETTLNDLISFRASVSAGYNGSTYAKGLGEEGNMMLMARELDHADFTTFRDNLKAELIDWFTFSAEEINRDNYYFARYPQSGALIGWPSGFGSQAFNDLHFHYGYFVMGAARMMLVDEEFKEQYGDMARYVAKAFANHKRYGVNDTTRLPFLRNFDPYFGHSFAGGTGDAGGNNQESTSEALHSWYAIYTLGVALNDSELIDLGLTGFKLESIATDTYWLDKNEDLPAEYPFDYVGILRTNSVSMATYFDGDPAWAFGIQFVPCDHFYQYYLSDDSLTNAETYASMLQDRIDFSEFTNTDRLDNVTEMGSYLGGYNLNYIQTYDPQFVVESLDHLIANGDASWSHDVNTATNYYVANNLINYGVPALNYHMSVPTGNVFVDKQTGELSYIVYNSTDEIVDIYVYEGNTVIDTITVNPRQLYNSQDTDPKAPQVLFSGYADGDLMIENETVTIEAYASDKDGVVEVVELWIADTLFARSTREPYEFQFLPIVAGNVDMYLIARDNDGMETTSETITITVIENNQTPYNGTAFSVPTDIIPAVEYDNGGQLIAYYDNDANNQGAGVRQAEGVDTEGGTGLNGNTGWNQAGEWLEYTINVESAGEYDMYVQYSSAYGGGEYSIHVDGENISGIQTTLQTASWADFSHDTITGLVLFAGEQVLRIYIESAGLNLRSIQFHQISTYDSFDLILEKGWNLVSVPMVLANPTIESVLPNATVVKTASSFWRSAQPTFLNTLTEIEAGVGYLVYNDNTETVTITGKLVDSSLMPVGLRQGWNLVGVSETISMDDFINATGATVVKDFEGFYEKGNDQSTLTELEAGKAYFIKSN